jgi:glycosyltransferase family protein
MKKAVIAIIDFSFKLVNQFILKFIWPAPKVLSVEKSLLAIIRDKKAVCRFGDGELMCLLGGGIRYQEANPLLASRLKQILSSDERGIEIGLPDVFSTKRLSLRTAENQSFWLDHLSNYRFQWYRSIRRNRTYLNTAISRFYIPFRDKDKSKQNSLLLKRIWQDKSILIVEGEKSRLGVGNDLFDNTEKITRIICPSENAFSKYEQILDTIKKFDRNVLVLIALGPTATVLAYDLGLAGYSAIDIGHVDLEYEWMKRGAPSQIKIEGKYVNEVSNGSVVVENPDKDNLYWNQICATII